MKSLNPSLEKDIEKKCLHYLNLNGWFAFKIDSVGARTSDGTFIKRQGRFTLRGISDAIAIKNGRVVFIEFKRDGGKQSQHQLAFQQAIERQDGEYWLIKTTEELKNRLGQQS